MSDLSSIMTLFREFEAKHRQAGDMSLEEEIAIGLLDECRNLEKRIMTIPAASARDLAAKLIVNTSYGDWCNAADDAFGADDEAAAEAAQSKASDATFAAVWNIIEHPYTSLSELKRGMHYLVEHHRSTGDGHLGEWMQGFACHLADVSEEEAA